MTNVPSTDIPDRSLTRDIVGAARYYLGGRRTLFALAAALVPGGVALNGGWPAAAGSASILITLLPCAVMCTLGRCMHRMMAGAHTGDRSEGSCQIANGRPAGRRVERASNHSQKGHGFC